MSEEYRIEKGIPMNEIRGGRKRYPFDKMEVGDSFTEQRSEVYRIRAAAIMHGARHQMKFSVRNCPENAELCRVWRIK